MSWLRRSCLGLLFVLLLVFETSCLPQVPRSCQTDEDCKTSSPAIFCDRYSTCNVRQCEPEIDAPRPCYTGKSGCSKNDQGDFSCLGDCKAGTQFCRPNGLWSVCAGESLPTREICDTADNDCDGKVDNTSGEDCSCTAKGASRPCYSGPQGSETQGVCAVGLQYCTDQNLWGRCESQIVPASEICDGLDNDCNGLIDDSNECSCEEGEKKPCYNGPIKTLAVGRCRAGYLECGNDRRWGKDCKDEVKPDPIVESGECNRIDDDCDGSIDEGCGCPSGKERCQGLCVSTQSDPKNCGKCGEVCLPTASCEGGLCKDCPSDRTRCSDTCVDVKTNAEHCGQCGKVCGPGLRCQGGVCEECPSDRTLCSGSCVDRMTSFEHCGQCGNSCGVSSRCVQGKCLCQEGATRSCYQGDPATRGKGLCSDGTETCKAGGQWGTCEGDRGPQAELCDGQDNDCDGSTDEGCACKPGESRLCYSGTDGCTAEANGYKCVGLCKSGVQACEPSGVWSPCRFDQGPQAELCDGQDNDCDGKTDEGLSRPCTSPCGTGTETCSNGVWGLCDAPAPQVEVCDGQDNDCDGKIDEDLEQKEPCDKQSGVCARTYKRCLFGSWKPCTPLEYGADHQRTSTAPLVLEVCDGKDNDCDGKTDENEASPSQSVCDPCLPTYRSEEVDILPLPNLASRSRMEFSPTREWFATVTEVTVGGGGGVLRLWNTATRKEMSVSPTISGVIVNRTASALRWHPKLDLVAIPTSAPHSILLWNPILQYEVQALLGTATLKHTSTIRDLAWSADGRWLVSVGDDQRLLVWSFVWERQKADVVQEIMLPWRPQAVALSADASKIYVGGATGIFEVIARATGQILRTHGSPGERVTTLALHPGREQIAVGYGYVSSTGVVFRKIRIFEPGVGPNPITTLEGQMESDPREIRYRPDGAILAGSAIFAGARLVFWDTDTWKVRGSLLSRTGYPFHSFGWDGQGKELFVIEDPRLAVYRCPSICSPTQGTLLDTSPDAITSLAVSWTGASVVWGDAKGVLRYKNQDSSPSGYGSTVSSAPSAPSNLSLAALSFYPLEFAQGARGAFFALAFGTTLHLFGGNPAGVYSSVSGNPVLTGSSTLRTVEFSPHTGLLLYAAGEDAGQIKLLSFFGNLPSNLPSATPYNDPQTPITATAFAPDGYRLAFASSDDKLRIIDLRQPALPPVILSANAGVLRSVAWSLDGRKIAVAGESGKIVVWDEATLMVLQSIPNEPSTLTNKLVWSPDSLRLLSADTDKRLRLWSSVTGALLVVWNDVATEHSDGIRHLHWFRDGRSLVSAGSDGKVFLWRCQP